MSADKPASQRTPGENHLLRFMTCGSVDDGKSTLIGRLLADSRSLYDDQLATLAADSARFGTTGADPDLALLLDGLEAERQQGITIDVAYRYFSTSRRHFIVADAPGHEQFTRNMATAASNVELAVLLVDARAGVTTQTLRHCFIVSLMGIKNVVLAVNKMDAVGWDREPFDRVVDKFRQAVSGLNISETTCIPVSALRGDNVVTPSESMPWYRGPPLLKYLEEVEVQAGVISKPFRMPVQWVNRPNQDFRGYSGTIAGGSVRPGDPIIVLPSGKTTEVARIVTIDGDLAQASAGDAVTITVKDAVDIARGDVLADRAGPPAVGDQYAAHLIWMADRPLLPGRPYLIAIGTAVTGGQVTDLKYKVNVVTQEHIAAKQLEINEIGFCNVALDRAVPVEPYTESRQLGSFIIIDRIDNATVGCGMIAYPLRRAANVHWQLLRIDKAARAALMEQRPFILWFTGLSGAGKSTIADLLEQMLHRHGHRTVLLDGDNIRHGLNRDLGFTDADRVENIRRVAEVAKLMVEAGLIVLVSFISPFRSERRMARELVGPDEFVEIYVNTPIDVCEARDPKGLYKSARAGKLPNFTGIGSPYEPPDHPELTVDGGTGTAQTVAEQILSLLRERGMIRR
jgi:bifunctional enzyme CysN/CysC